jgi:hypothetical protein
MGVRGATNVQLVAPRTSTCPLHCVWVVKVHLVAPDESTCTFPAPHPSASRHSPRGPLLNARFEPEVGST